MVMYHASVEDSPASKELDFDSMVLDKSLVSKESDIERAWYRKTLVWKETGIVVVAIETLVVLQLRYCSLRNSDSSSGREKNGKDYMIRMNLLYTLLSSDVV